jgi:hypothetical protein
VTPGELFRAGPDDLIPRGEAPSESGLSRDSIQRTVELSVGQRLPTIPQRPLGRDVWSWVDAAVSGAIGLVAVPPVLLGTAYGIWKENQLDQEVWQVIDKAVGTSQL